MAKTPLGTTVLAAARDRVAWLFETFPRVYVSFSGGKDSSVMLHLVCDEARKRGRRVGVLIVDLEGQYRLTIDHVRECLQMYADIVEPFWVALPISLRNAVSQFEPKWLCWDPDRRDDWIREPPPEAIVDEQRFPFFRRGMEFEEFVPAFGQWYSQGLATACCVGIRADESLNRFRTLIMRKSCMDGRRWTTWCGGTAWNAYPVYDWHVKDIWTYCGRFGRPYNRLYDLMHKAGLTLSQMRICQPYGDDQRRGLWLYHLIEPDTWSRVVARVSGANSGAQAVQETGNISGYRKITLPAGHTWKSFAKLLLASMPPKTREHYEDKISVFLAWYRDRGYPNGIPDSADAKAEADKNVPSWRRVCKALLRNDYWCKGLSFTPQKSAAYEQYRRIMKKRRQRWGQTF